MQSLALLVVLALSVAFVVSKPVAKDGGADVDKGFEAWKTQFGKSYASAEEESRRKSIWLVQKKMMEEHNKRAENGLESYTMGLNFFSDLESHEIPMGVGPPQGAASRPDMLNKQRPNRPKPSHPPPHHMIPEDSQPPPSQIPTRPEAEHIIYDDKADLFPHYMNNHPYYSHE